MQNWFRRRIRPAGLGALLAVAVGSFLSVGQPKNSIFQIFCFSLGLVALSLTWTFFRRARISATLELPRHATAGETLHYAVRVENIGKRSLRGARLAQTPPDPRPSIKEFAGTPEPGEEKRNIFDKTMIYYRWRWLTARNSRFTSRESHKSLHLKPSESLRVSMELTPARRGVIPIGNVRVLLPDPLGFFQKCSRTQSTPARLVVLPKRYRLPPLVMHGSAAFRIGSEETSNAIGSAGEFAGLREYRFGDPLRLIHWKSWAHTGRPMVKELEDIFWPRYTLVLDTFPSSPGSDVFEEMVSVAASCIVGLERSNSQLDLMFLSGEANTVTAGRGMADTENLLEILAGVKTERHSKLDLLAQMVIRHREKMTCCLLVLNGWDVTRENFVKSLLKAAIPCIPLVVGNGSAPPRLIGHWLECDHIARDLLSLPTTLSAAS